MNDEFMFDIKAMKPAPKLATLPVANSLLVLLFLFVSTLMHSSAEYASYPAEWKMETLENQNDEWWETLSVQTVPGVVYRLEKSETLESNSWREEASLYGTGVEWVNPVFRGTAPTAAQPAGSRILPENPQVPIRHVGLLLEKSADGGTLISWRSLDSQTPMRKILTGVILDPVWGEFDSWYFNQHGSYFFSISPRIWDPVNFSPGNDPTGPLDTVMLSTFIAALPTITSNLQNSLDRAAAYTPQPEAFGTRGFYRYAADWGVDSDGDGRYDWQELVLDGNNPFDSDSDGDGNLDQARGPGSSGGSSGYPTPTDADGPTPLATIEQQTVLVGRSENNYVNQNAGIGVYVGGALDPSMDQADFFSASTWSALKTAVDAIAFPETATWSSLGNLSEEHVYGTSGESGEIWNRELLYSRARFRLKLDKPAPPEGYQIPFRVAIVRQHISGNGSDPVLPAAEGEADYVELILQCDPGETDGTPVELKGPESLEPNRRITFVPACITTREPDVIPVVDGVPQSELATSGGIVQNGVCVFDETFVVDFGNPEGPEIAGLEEPLKVRWLKGKLGGSGDINWSKIYKANLQSPLEPQPLEGTHATVADQHSGIYQLKALLVVSEAIQVEIPFVRLRNSKSMKDRDGVANPLLVAGQPDYFGICPNQQSKAIRNKAIDWLGATAYARENNVPMEPGNPFNFSTARSPKCNIFVTHIANQAGAATPYYNRIRIGISTPQTAAPIAKWDWHFNPEQNIDLDPYGWHYLDNAVFPPTNPTVETFSNQFHSLRSWIGGPCPGMVCSSPRTAAGPRHGHVGIMDYDGSWINAGAINVNKSLHLQDELDHYKPNTFRAR